MSLARIPITFSVLLAGTYLCTFELSYSQPLPSAQATAAAVPQNLPGHYKGGSIEEKSLGIHACTRMDMEGELDADGNFKGFAHVKWSTSGKTFLNNDAHLNVTGI